MAANNTADELGPTRRLVESIRAWAATSAPAVAVSEVLNPGDEYGSYCVMTLRPGRASACDLEIYFVPADPPQIGVALDSWHRLVEGHHLPVSLRTDRERQFKTLFLEPRTLSLDTLSAICRAVSQGAVDLRAGIIGHRLVATIGGVQLTMHNLAMQGVACVPLMVPKMLQRIGLGKVLSIKYEPWQVG